ncbi:MAG: hypothetical protein GY859_19430 [Desulfobacterales bacterium]|nr:hypothetical protein [Desulfobacterales bacterium]
MEKMISSDSLVFPMFSRHRFLSHAPRAARGRPKTDSGSVAGRPPTRLKSNVNAVRARVLPRPRCDPAAPREADAGVLIKISADILDLTAEVK